MNLNIVLVEPEIPQNTGNIARTCAAIGAALHLIEPLGFRTDDKHLKRAGLDYWHMLDTVFYNNLDDFFIKNQGGQFVFITTKAERSYSGITYKTGCFLIFGKETAGLPEELLRKHYKDCVRIPMKPEARSLNLSNAAAVIAYEALRQQDFPDLQKGGFLKPLPDPL